MNFTKNLGIRYATFAFGLISALALTAHQLSTSTSDSEFWTELTTGSGLAFFLYALPYGAYFLFSRTEKSLKALAYESGALLILGLTLITIAFMPKAPLKPEDVALFDPAILVVLFQIVIVAGFAGLRNQSKS